VTTDMPNNTPSGCDLPTDSRSDTMKALEAIRDLEHLPGWEVVERVLGLQNLYVLVLLLLRGSWDDAVADALKRDQQPKALREGLRAPRQVSDDLQELMAIALGFSDKASAIAAHPGNPFFSPAPGQPWPSAPTAPAELPQADSEAPAPDNFLSGGCSFVPAPAPDDNV
jgi:hypothetical protein